MKAGQLLRRLLKMFKFAFLLPVIIVVRGQINGPIVTTRQGSLLGRDEFVDRRRIYSFRGIKYAEAGQRFSYSIPYTDSWSGTKSAVEDTLPCPQPYLGPQQYSEECKDETQITGY